MLPTFVIGLREGLEAALIVSIIATFLRRNGASLRGLWIGVGTGVGLSIAVGVVLRVIEQSLPQRQQEMLETVVGVIAICFVTGMIIWMRTHARTMKRELETAAAAALRNGTTTALAVMGFLAVLREGFETSVFLLAAIQNAANAPAALVGAVLGLLVACGLGWGMYAGGVRLNLQMFFKVTGIFLVFVAAGLVMNALRTAHEAGWVTVGQGATVDLTWFTPPGSVRAAIISGILGIQPDPRVIEVIGWLAYLVPMLASMLWPADRLPSKTLARRLRLAGAGVAVVAAVALFAGVPTPSAHVSPTAQLADGRTATVHVSGRTATLVAGSDRLRLTDPRTSGGETTWKAAATTGKRPGTLDATTLMTYTGNRVPVGMSIATAPGPYAARWAGDAATTVVTRDGGLVDVRSDGQQVLTISGGGLTSPRTFTVGGSGWQIDPAYAAEIAQRTSAADATAHDRMLWKHWLPVTLIITAGVLLWQSRRRGEGPAGPGADNDPAPKDEQAPAVEGHTHVA